jgi:transcriptional regulator with XRE-family HTH domain
MTEKTIHQGRNVKRLREILDIKQETLAFDLGLSQQTVSAMEQKEALDEQMLQRIAAILKVPVKAIKNFNEEATISIISNTYDNGSISYQKNEQCTFNINTAEKWMEALEENKTLYERLLQSEKEKVTSCCVSV